MTTVLSAESPRAPAGSLPEGPATNRMVVAVLSLAGFFVSFYLLAYSLGWLGEIICGVGSCAEVQSSDYATVGPVPVPVLGVVGYTLLFVAALLGIQPGWREAPLVALVLLGGSTFGFLASMWFTWVEAFIIRAWCQWCVVSAVLMTVIFFASLPEIRRLRSTGGTP